MYVRNVKEAEIFNSEFLEDGYLVATYPIRVPCADYKAILLFTKYRNVIETKLEEIMT
jgi:hypothetical protein